MKKILLLSLLISITLLSYAQTRVNPVRYELKIEKPFAKFNKSTGWIRGYSGDWRDYKNEIYGIDQFKELSLSKATFRGKEYICFTKKYRITRERFNELELKYEEYNTTSDTKILLDVGEYKRAFQRIQMGDNEIRLKWIKEVLGSYLEYEDMTNSKDEELVFKFRINQQEGWVRFLIYRLDNYNNYSTIYDLTEIPNERKKELGDILKYGDLFNEYYYECKIEDFLKFIISPYKKLN